MSPQDITLFSTADWRAAAWTNKQHVALTLANMGHRVLYVEGIGIRKPTLAAQDTRRIFRRIKRLFRPLTRVNANLSVLSLPFLPWHHNRLAGWLNRRIIASGVWLAESWLRFRRPILWTYHPLTTRWLQPEKYGRSVYHCVDEIGAQPGMALQVIEQAERDLAARVNYVCTTAPALAEKLIPENPHCEFMPNVADFDHFQVALKPATVVPSDLQHIPQPRCGFVGAISGYKINFDLVKQVALLRPTWSFVMIGEVGLGETGFQLGALPPNVHVLGPRPYAVLPEYCKGFTAGLLPYHVNDYTRGVFPMKLFEYMAAGLPVISTSLPALADYRDYVHWADSAAELAEKLDATLAGDGPSFASRLTLAQSNTYQSRTARMLAALESSDEIAANFSRKPVMPLDFVA